MVAQRRVQLERVLMASTSGMSSRQNLRDLFRALRRQRGEEQGVDAAEDRRVAENANRQRQDGDDREAGRTDERPHGVPQVLTQAWRRT